jgi:putative acetyltransferase
MTIIIRSEEAQDESSIRAITEAAFKGVAYSAGTEGLIVDGLRAANALTVSLVAVEEGELVGHVAFSPVAIDGADFGWFGLGPVSVRPDRQGQGIGSRLIHEGLDRLRALGAKGCVLLGDPGYYGRFGFETDAALRYEGAPPGYFMRLSLKGPAPQGTVTFHEAFDAS